MVQDQQTKKDWWWLFTGASYLAAAISLVISQVTTHLESRVIVENAEKAALYGQTAEIFFGVFILTGFLGIMRSI